MAEVTIPAIKAGSASFGLVRADVATELLNGAEVYTIFNRAVWTMTINLVIQTEQQGREWSGALARLSSFGNFFKASPPGYSSPIYSGSAPQVNGANQLGTTISLKNITPSAVVFRSGEYFEVNGELKIVTATATANGSGIASVNFEPALRASPADSASVVISSPKASFRLAQPAAQWNIQPGKFYAINIDAIEKI
jgi:hypothetical protein